MKKSKNHDKAVKKAYNALVTFRKRLEEKGENKYAEEVEEIYKQLWCECLNEPALWC